MRGVAATLVAVVCAVSLTACSHARPTTPGAGPQVAAAPPAAPPARACYALPFGAILNPSNAARPVPCTGRHTTETLYVGSVDPLVDGHLLAIDSDRIQRQIARTCQARTAAHLGGSPESQRLARLQSAWFSPTLQQSEAGAIWFRCDLVLLAGPATLAPLPAHTRGLLRSPTALDRFGTCGTTSPSNRSFQRVVCSRRHSWRARATILFGPGTTYLGTAAGKSAQNRCHDIESQIATDHLKLVWSFEWPTRAQWDAGQRYGFCWTPDPA